jgi:hypothetical protein
MDAAMERRAEKRVCPPGDAVLAFALWPSVPAVSPRLFLSVLGPPLAKGPAGHGLELADITARGLGLHVRAEPGVLERLAASPALYVYLKLRDYRPQAPAEVLSLFFHALTAHAVSQPDGLALGLRLSHQGWGSVHEKALELLDVSRFGVPELVAWIDALARNMALPRRTACPGIDLDHLLDEPECVPVASPAQGNPS